MKRTRSGDDEVEAAPVVEAQALEPQAPVAPLPGTFQSVTLEAWSRHAFGKLDHGGAFVRWARKNGHTRHSSAEWAALSDSFNQQPA